LSNEAEATCQYEGCKRKIARDSKCIFHLPNKNPRERLEFKASLPSEIKRIQKDSTERTIALSGFQFPGPAYKFPTATKFEKEVNFSDVAFEGDVDFSRCEFLDYVTFEYAKFSGKASFEGAKFLGFAIFVQSEFLSEASFVNSEFLNVAGFDLAKFSHGAKFSNAKFHGEVSFSEAKLSDYVLFINTEFLGRVFFDGSEFSDHASFLGSKFLGDAYFSDAKFGTAIFDVAKFSGDVFFERTEFSGDAFFDSTEFSGLASFFSSKVAGILTFKATVFQTKDVEISSSPIKQFTIFEEINVNPRGEVRFEGGICMSRVSLHYTDIRRFSFIDVKWGRLGGRASVMEHGILKEGKRDSTDAEVLPQVSPEHVQQIYVRLRRNLERGAGRYPEAGDFFINEKEMRTLILQEGRRWPRLENLPEWGVLKVYGWLALYGESIMLPIYWSLVAVVGLWPLRALSFRLQTVDAKPYLNFLMESVMAFFQMRSEPGLDILERLISVPILGSLFIALKRKFERR